MITLYGINNCDTVKKAKRWLLDNEIQFQFYDFKTEGVNKKQVETWMKIFGDNLINKRGTTWRQLSELEKNNSSLDQLIELIIKYPTLIKRPLLMADKINLCGFDINDYQKLKD